MKTIVVKWWMGTMHVIASDHERFIVGSRFDFGFFTIATNEGYTIVSLPA